MKFRRKGVKTAQAREMDMVNCLSAMNFEPAKIRNNDYWYHSPLWEEKTPSFKVSRRLNRWYDHGIGRGGNLLDFAVLFWGCSVSEALQKLAGNFSLHQHPAKPLKIVSKKESAIKITGEFLLSSPALLDYLAQRHIPLEIASKFCCEVHYEMSGRTWFAIGFKNDFGGYEIRNAFHKLSSSPKGITTIQNNSDSVIVFEGIFDFLSFMVITSQERFQQTDFIILNSLAFLESMRSVLDSYKNVYLLLDNDAAGKTAAQLALSWGKHYQDKSFHHEDYGDPNDWLVRASNCTGATSIADFFIKEKPPNLPEI